MIEVWGDFFLRVMVHTNHLTPESQHNNNHLKNCVDKVPSHISKRK